MGKGVKKAVEIVNKHIAPALIGLDVTDQRNVDKVIINLDGTTQKSKLGGNSTTVVSLAVAKAAAASLNLPLYRYLGGLRAFNFPILCPNLISGSTTAAGSELDFEDYLIVPYGFETMEESIVASVEIFHALHDILQKKFGPIPQITALSPPLKSNEAAFDTLSAAIERAGYTGKIGFGIDVASGLIYDTTNDTYRLRERNLSREELVEYYRRLCDSYPILFIEDGLHEDDFDGFALMRRNLPCLVVGDDLFASNKHRLLQGVEKKAGNAILLKINQIGTITEALETAELATQVGYSIVASVRSGETDDASQADFAMAVGAKLMKIGSPIRGEMITKYNRFLTIFQEMGNSSYFQGKGIKYLKRGM
jgi:enolase